MNFDNFRQTDIDLSFGSPKPILADQNLSVVCQKPIFIS